MCKGLGIQQNLSTAFHPRTDGQTEQMNTWVEQYLHPWTSTHPNRWAPMLPIAKYAHNSWKHNKTQHTPYKVLIGFKPLVNIKLMEDNVPAALNRLTELENM